MIDVVAIGELLIDFACESTNAQGYPLLQANPGGAPGNFLATLQQYGCTTAMLGKVGDDAFGKLLLQTLSQKKIDTSGIIQTASAFTTLAFVTLDETGNREFSFARKPGADTQLCENELRTELIDNAKVLHFGTLSLTDEPARTATQHAISYAKARHKRISVDPNLRKPLWRSEQEMRQWMLWSLQQADIVKISDEEVAFLWGCSPQQAAQKLIEEFGASLVYVTLGARGCYAATANVQTTVASPQGIAVVDTTGAGDIFNGSAMYQFLALQKEPNMLTHAELTDIVRFACTAASLSTMTYGAISSIVDKDIVLQHLHA